MLHSNRLTIYAIGKIKKIWIRDGIYQYKKRMPELIINELKTFNLNNLRSNNNIIICLSEEGRQFNSVELCSLLLNFKNKKINFLIGDTNGISPDIKRNSDLILSLHINTLTFLGLVQVTRKDLTIIYLIYPCLQELILMNILMRMNMF